MTDKKLTKFEEAYQVSCADLVEKKNKLTYLSWANAWKIMKIIYPDATYKIIKNNNNMPYFTDNSGAVCYTEVTAAGETHEMWLPVMDGANKAMKEEPYTYQVKEWVNGKPTGKFIDKPVEAYTMFDINKTVMRCLTKNLAMFGIGLYIFEGEDMPEDISNKEAYIKEDDKNKIKEDAFKLILNCETPDSVTQFIKNHKNAWIKSIGANNYNDIEIKAAEHKKTLIITGIKGKIDNMAIEEMNNYFTENQAGWRGFFDSEQFKEITNFMDSKRKPANKAIV